MAQRALELDSTLDTPLDEVMEGLLRDDDPQIRGGAARMLGMMENRRSVPSLHESLQDPVDWVRGEVAMALGRICHPSSVAYLEPVLQDAGYEELEPRVKHALTRLRRIYSAMQTERELEPDPG